MKAKRHLIATVFTIGALMGAGSASATDTTFAQWISTSARNDLVWSASGVNGRLTTRPAPLAVRFSNLLPSLYPYIGDVPAHLTLTNVNEIGNAATGTRHHITQEGIGGAAEFTNDAPIVIRGRTFAAGSNLLTVIFTGADLTGRRSSSSASFQDSSVDGTVVFTSDFMTFQTNAQEDFSWALTSILPLLNFTPGKALSPFTGSGTGTFDSDPAPIAIATPEPATWGLMLLGSSLMGLKIRRRRKAEIG